MFPMSKRLSTHYVSWPFEDTWMNFLKNFLEQYLNFILASYHLVKILYIVGLSPLSDTINIFSSFIEVKMLQNKLLIIQGVTIHGLYGLVWGEFPFLLSWISLNMQYFVFCSISILHFSIISQIFWCYYTWNCFYFLIVHCYCIWILIIFVYLSCILLSCPAYILILVIIIIFLVIKNFYPFEHVASS